MVGGPKQYKNLVSYLCDETECNLKGAGDTVWRAVGGMVGDQGVL